MTVRSVGLEAPVPEARSRHTAHMIGDVLHLVGGYDGGKPCAGDVFTLDCSDPLAMESVDASGGGDAKKKKDDENKEEED